MCVEGDFHGFLAAEDVEFGPFARSISFVVLMAVVIEVERVVVIVVLLGDGVELYVKLFGGDGFVIVAVIVVGGVTGGFVVAAPDEFYGC